jgi:hypothetical protein
MMRSGYAVKGGRRGAKSQAVRAALRLRSVLLRQAAVLCGAMEGNTKKSSTLCAVL